MKVAEIVKGIQPVDSQYIEKARERTAQLALPPRALGRLHDISERLCGIQQTLQPDVTRRAKIELGQNGRQLLIFPEGTRRAPGAPPAYKFGAAHLYAELGVPCVPVALNTGLYWPRRKFLRRPGTVRIEILPAIEPGLDKVAFQAILQERIETASDRLLAQGRAELAARGMDPLANS